MFVYSQKANLQPGGEVLSGFGRPRLLCNPQTLCGPGRKPSILKPETAIPAERESEREIDTLIHLFV